MPRDRCAGASRASACRLDGRAPRARGVRRVAARDIAAGRSDASLGAARRAPRGLGRRDGRARRASRSRSCGSPTTSISCVRSRPAAARLRSRSREIGPGGKLGERRVAATRAGSPSSTSGRRGAARACARCRTSISSRASIPSSTCIAINLDDPAEARALFDKRRLPARALADDGDTSERFGVTSIPHTVVIDRDGMLRDIEWRARGPDPSRSGSRRLPGARERA